MPERSYMFSLAASALATLKMYEQDILEPADQDCSQVVRCSGQEASTYDDNAAAEVLIPCMQKLFPVCALPVFLF